MTDTPVDAANNVAHLLSYYSFDLGGKSIEGLIDEWLRQYPAVWLRLATIEALYQGRYKAVSVEQILVLWRRRGKPLQHFNREFEAIVCRQFATKPAKPADWRGAIARPLSSQSSSQSSSQFSSQSDSDASFAVQDMNQDWTTQDAINLDEADWNNDLALDPEDVAASLSSEQVVSLISAADVLPSTTGAESSAAEWTHWKSTWQSSEVAEPAAVAYPFSAEFLAARSQPPFDPAIGHRASIQAFQPVADSSLDAFSIARSAHLNGSHRQPIHQFVPFPETSEFYAKLRFLAHRSPYPNPNANQSGSSSNS